MAIQTDDTNIIESNSTNNRSFSEVLDANITANKFSSYDQGWIHFLYDHYRYIKERSVSAEISEATMRIYQYRVRDYLRDYHRNEELELAFRIINRLPDDKDFNYKITLVYVPTMETIQSLYRSYCTYRSKIAK